MVRQDAAVEHEGKATEPAVRRGAVPDPEVKHLDDFLGRLKGVQECGRGWKACCPAHPDERPSLSVSLGEDNRIMLYCHTGCYTDEVLRAMGLRFGDLFATPEDRHVRGPVTPSRRAAEATPAEMSFRGEVYRDLLDGLPLLEEHRQDLLRRGLTPDQINANGYRSVDGPDHRRAAATLYEVHGERLFSVPGFRRVKRTGRPDTAALTLNTGLVIPARNREGEILALQVRTGERSGKYRWLSGGDGGSSGCPPHVPLAAVGMSKDTIRVTEGPLKADVAMALDPSIPTIAAAGVSSWKAVLPLVDAWKPKQVRVAWDADWKTKAAVRDSLYQLTAALDRTGYEVVAELWQEADGKGIDDLLRAGKRPTVERPQVPESVRLAATEGAAAGEQAEEDDPHRLARRFLEGQTVRYWQGGFWAYRETNYQELSEDAIKARLTRHVRAVFDRDHAGALADWDAECQRIDRRNVDRTRGQKEEPRPVQLS